MRIAVDFPLTQLLDEYAEQSARYREPVAANALDKRARRTLRNGLHVDLRWILLHLTGETARHNGHLDILRDARRLDRLLAIRTPCMSCPPEAQWRGGGG